jgi:transcriptional regulator with XRE-family HTH domain
LPYGLRVAPIKSQSRSKYSDQRKPVSIPVVPLAVARKLADKTLQEVCDHINNEFEFPKKVERGTISGIENGHRGASAEMLVAIASALGVSADDINTQYEPRRSRQGKQVA